MYLLGRASVRSETDLRGRVSVRSEMGNSSITHITFTAHDYCMKSFP